MKIKLIILWCVSLFAGLPTDAQEYIRYGLSEGLSGIEVTDIKENDNYIWIATSNGLNRFDGEKFKIFKRNPDVENSITNNNIETLFFDSSGRLWIGLKNGGLDVYDPRNDKFLNISSMINIKAPERVISIFEDSSGDIWLGTWEQGACQLTPVGGDSLKFTAQMHFPGYIVSSFAEKPQGFLRIGTYSGLLVFDMVKKDWSYPDSRDMVFNQFLSTEKPGSVLCSTWNSGLWEMTWDADDPARVSLSNVVKADETLSIHRILDGPDNSVYVGTWGSGMLKLDLNNPKELHSLDKSEFPPSFINCIFRDKFRNIWVGTFGEGVFKFNPDHHGIRHFPAQGVLPKPAVTIIPTADSKLLIGTQGAGVLEADLENGKVTPRFQKLFDTNFKNYVLLMHADQERFFITHDGNGLYFCKVDEKPESNLREIIPDISKVTAVYSANDHKVWFGTKQNGLFSVEIGDEGSVGDTISFPVIGHNEITGIIPFNHHQLLISSNNGLVLFDTLTGQIVENGTLISGEPVYAILKDPVQGMVWIGTSSNVMACHAERPDSLVRLFPDELMPSGPVMTIITDNENNLWFSAGERLFCKTKNENSVREINPELAGTKTILSVSRTEVGNAEILVFGTSENLLLIDPKLILDQVQMPKVILSGLFVDNLEIKAGDKLYNQVVTDVSPEYATSLVLSYKSRWITFSFAETGQTVFKNYYKFRIRGLSDTWQYTGLDDPVTFSQLLPGDYTLEIKGINSDDHAGPDWALDLLVTPPWWQTRIARIMAALIMLCLAIFTFVYINKRTQRRHFLRLVELEKEKKEELIREKESFINGLSHDFLTTFSLILAPVNDLLREGRISESNREKMEIIKKNTTFLSDMFGAIFDFKKSEFSDRKITETDIELVSFIRICVQAFEYLAVSKNITLGYQSGIDRFHVRIDHLKLERIIYNLLSNSMKFTPEGGSVMVTLNLLHESKTMVIGVKDTGIGMDTKSRQLAFEKFYRAANIDGQKSPNGLGLGLYLVKKFTGLLGGTVSVESVVGEGTYFTVSIPAKLAAEEGPVPGEARNEQAVGDKSTILVVEDNRQLLDYMVKKLKTQFNVLTAENGTEAMSLVGKYIPEIVITDIVMPGIEGLQLTQAIKTDARFSDIFVVILSAKATTDDELAGYRHGADIYLRKPIDTEVLLSQMINIHKTRQKRKTQLYTELVSKSHSEIEFDSRESFLKMAIGIVEKNLMEADFNLDDFASELNVSKSVLHRKFKLLVGQTPNQFVRLVRLRKAVELLEQTDLSISEIAYTTGFSQAHYFIKCFREVYKETPKNYRDKSMK